MDYLKKSLFPEFLDIKYAQFFCLLRPLLLFDEHQLMLIKILGKNKKRDQCYKFSVVRDILLDRKLPVAGDSISNCVVILIVTKKRVKSYKQEIINKLPLICFYIKWFASLSLRLDNRLIVNKIFELVNIDFSFDRNLDNENWNSISKVLNNDVYKIIKIQKTFRYKRKIRPILNKYLINDLVSIILTYYQY